ncbi:MAG: ABC-2 transporter permease [Oscillospiraceae bacterium]|nr:ABC-2 transporter permease [Oscillospiraceae bacterium]
MKALLLLDGYTLMKQLKLFLAFIVLYAGLSLYSQEFMLLGFSTIFLVLLPYYLMQYCETFKTDALFLLLPNTLKTVVQERYLTLLFTLVHTAVLAGVTELVLDPESALLIAVECALGLIAMSVIVPLAFKFGVTKSRMVLIFAIAALGSFGGIVGSVLGGDVAEVLSGSLLHTLSLLSLPIALVVVLISYHVSLALYTQREF